MLMLLHQRRFDEARQVMLQQRPLWESPGAFKPFMDMGRAYYEWHTGDRQLARSILLGAVQGDQPAVYKAGSYYYLGLGAEIDKQPDEARRYFTLSVQAASNHWAGVASQKKLETTYVAASTSN